MIERERPDPDALLARVHAEEQRAERGRLRIYFGSSAGVGKTYAMLAGAQRAKGEGRDVVVGLVETHGRSETAALLAGLEVLPLTQLVHRNRTFSEFDIDAALARRPQLLLVDELAHTNAPGSRHPKRWQDVQELLAAGIDVHTTLNVQHLESLNDVVGGITGIRVQETLPDRVLETAEEVILVDITAEELLARLAQGKVYVPAQAERAMQSFFRKGNLIALRELALRRVAERIGGDVQAYRSERSIERIWKTGHALLACIGPSEAAERTVRGVARWAAQLETPWHAVYVETPRLQRLPAAERERILQVLKLAESLGAKTAVLGGDDAAAALASYARQHNLGRIALGRPLRSSARGLRGALQRIGPAFSAERRVRSRLGTLLPEADLLDIPSEPSSPRRVASPAIQADAEDASARRQREFARYAGAAGFVCVAGVLSYPLAGLFELPNIVMVFLLAVVATGYRFGRGPAVLASVLGVAVFDFFFVPPRLTFEVSDVQYVLTFGVMLVVGLATGQLTASLKYQARIAADREARAQQLYEVARDLAGAVLTEQIDEVARQAIAGAFDAECWLLLPDEDGRLRWPPADTMAMPVLASADASALPDELDLAVAQWSHDRGEAAGYATDTLPSSTIRYLPLKAPMRVRGVLAVRPRTRRLLLIPERQRQLETIASLIGIALERVHYVQVAQSATVRIESEQLRNSLLAAISHDLRTPLTALVGWAELLELSTPPLAERQRQIVASIAEEARRTSRLVDNLLQMARLETGETAPRMQWQSIEEIVGSAIRSVQPVLAGAAVTVRLAPDLPMVRCDAVLVERVVANLLENAAKYGRSPATGELQVDVEGSAQGDEVVLTVSDRGAGLPPRVAPGGDAKALFEKFTRGEPESSVPGLGLGLSICRAIVQAHGGRIWGRNREGGGAVFGFALAREASAGQPEAPLTAAGAVP